MNQQRKRLFIKVNQFFFWIFLLMKIQSTSATSYNQPKFSATAVWSTKAVMFANQSRVGKEPFNVFIDRNNTIYVSAKNLNAVPIWLENSSSPSSIFTGLKKPESIFVTENRTIYIGDGNNQVTQYVHYSSATSTIIFRIDKVCRGLFVDQNNTLYCSLVHKHQVIKKSLSNRLSQIEMAGGNGNEGSDLIRLNEPKGIFVSKNFSLYVADYKNDRIQMFQSGSLIGITVVGATAPGTISLSKPIDVALDGNNYFFIVDSGNNRIVGSGPNGFRCVASCSGQAGSGLHQLDDPRALSFDTYGNFYIADGRNNRIQKFILIQNTSNGTIDISYNEPILCPTAVWNPTAITFADQNIIGTLPWDIFVNTKNTLYLNAKTKGMIQIWFEGNSTPAIEFSHSLNETLSIFVTVDQDIYINGDRNSTSRIEKWSLNGTLQSVEMFVNGKCHGIFVDIYKNIYCSLVVRHQVLRKLSNNDANVTSVIAGYDNGTAGSTLESLNKPFAIFVTITRDLYVADCLNNRVQLFKYNQRNATTVVGSNDIDLNCPAGLAFDGDGNLFISDCFNQRIVGPGPNGYRCIAGCGRINGSALDQLARPRSIRFDSYGNLFVADDNNHRIQKFLLDSKSCVISYTRPQFCSSATWKSDGITILNTTNKPSSIFIHSYDYLYINLKSPNCISIWRTNNMSLIDEIVTPISDQTSIFVTLNEDIYMDMNSSSNYQITKWFSNKTRNETILSMNGRCNGLFVDLDNRIYCSMGDFHQVIRKSLIDNSNSSTIIAGNGTSGSSSTTLSKPQGIFVTTDFNLYVADCQNDRIQYFLFDQRNGTSVILTNANETFILNCPTSVFIDVDGFLFISDSLNHRIIGSGSDGYRCIVGCSGTSGSSANQLSNPSSFSFDSLGNLYVIDSNNNRIQKYLLNDNFCIPKFLLIFIPPMCLGTTNIGEHCDILNDPCRVLHPCQNNGTCVEATNVSYGFICLCPKDISGFLCQNDDRLCQSDTCRNDGTCKTITNVTFSCHCSSNWTGNRCEMRINFCDSSPCLNNGVCRSLVGGYRCECLTSFYSGRHCEKDSNGIQIREILAKSFAYVAIIFICGVVMFFVMMDVLKYFFDIDPVKTSKPMQKPKPRRKKFIIISKFSYMPGRWDS